MPSLYIISDSINDHQRKGSSKQRKGNRSSERGASQKGDGDVAQLRQVVVNMAAEMNDMKRSFDLKLDTMQTQHERQMSEIQKQRDDEKQEYDRRLKQKDEEIADLKQKLMELCQQLMEREEKKSETCNGPSTIEYEISEEAGWLGKFWKFLCSLTHDTVVILYMGGSAICTASVKMYTIFFGKDVADGETIVKTIG